jgi:serine/threonine-protein kinase
MDATRWEALKGLFEEASTLPTDERARFLEKVHAADPEAGVQLEPLLGASEKADAFFDDLADEILSRPPWLDDTLAGESDVPDPLIGRSVRQYEIEEILGRGGMGVVYRARDMQLGRSVALKFLPPHLSADEAAKERFLVEARAAAALDHPNVCTIHEVAEDDEGRLFIAMAFYEGETLKERIERGPLPVEEALDYARQIAAGLEVAHAHDIMHRDIKPGNVIVTSDGLAKVLDFGLAKLTDITLTGSKTTMGTVAYMSPEQAGHAPVDHRTDLWSLGVVLYEMLAGERPFQGDVSAVVIHAILNEEPTPLSTLRPEVPAEVEALMARLLAKDPEERFDTADALLEALATPEMPLAVRPRPLSRLAPRWAAAALVTLILAVLAAWWLIPSSPDSPPRARPWTVVAEFEGTADPSYLTTFRTILSDELSRSTVVAPLPRDQIRRGLELAGRPDTTSLREDVARQLAVRGSIRTIVTAQVDRVGSSYSVLARVLDAESGTVVVSDRRVAEGDDELLPVLERTARGLRAGLGESADAIRATRPLAEVSTPSFQAYQKYVEALRLRNDELDFAGSKRLVQEALEIDPGFAAAWLLLRQNYNAFRHYDSMPVALEQAKRHRDRLTEAEQWDLVAHDTLFSEAKTAALERALEADPNNLVRYRRLANRIAGADPERALNLLDRAASISPFGLYQLGHRLRTSLLIGLGRTSEAREYANYVEPENVRRWYLQLAAMRDADWVAAESLAVEIDFDRTFAEPGPDYQAYAHGLPRLVSLHVVRGEMSAARQVLARAQTATRGTIASTPTDEHGRLVTNAALPVWVSGGGFASMLFYIVTEALPLPRDSTCWQIPLPGDACWRGAHTASVAEALQGDTIATRHALSAFAADTFTTPGFLRQPKERWSERDTAGVATPMVLSAAAFLAGDWAEVVRLGDPIVERIPWGGANQLTRWMVADAFRRLGRLERAADRYETFARVDFMGQANIASSGITYPFAHRHLALIYTELGDQARAIEHWTTFLDTFTNPDPEYEWMVEEGQRELARLRS